MLVSASCDDAVERDRPRGIQVVEVLVHVDVAGQPGAARELAAMRAHRERQAEVVQVARTQALDHLVLQLDGVGQHLQHPLQALAHLARAFGQAALDPVQIHVDRREIAAERVVQLARELGFFLLGHADQVLRQLGELGGALLDHADSDAGSPRAARASALSRSRT